MAYHRGSEFGTVEDGRERPGQVVPEFFYQPGFRYLEDNSRVPSNKQHEFVRFNIIGDMTKAPESKVTDRIRRMYRDEYEAFKRGEQFLGGEPLEKWTPLAMHDGLIRLLKLHHVHTVQALAEISQEQAAKIGLGIDEFQAKAQAYVEHQKAEAPENRLKSMEVSIAKLQAENEALRAAQAKSETQDKPWRNAASRAAAKQSEPADAK